MIKRERWIVYPLLFLVISISLKDKLNSQQKSLQLKNLKVDQLEVGRTTSKEGTPTFAKYAGHSSRVGGCIFLIKKAFPKLYSTTRHL